MEINKKLLIPNLLPACFEFNKQLHSNSKIGHVTNSITGYRFFSPYIKFAIKINRSNFRK